MYSKRGAGIILRCWISVFYEVRRQKYCLLVNRHSLHISDLNGTRGEHSLTVSIRSKKIVVMMEIRVENMAKTCVWPTHGARGEKGNASWISGGDQYTSYPRVTSASRNTVAVRRGRMTRRIKRTLFDDCRLMHLYSNTAANMTGAVGAVITQMTFDGVILRYK